MIYVASVKGELHMTSPFFHHMFKMTIFFRDKSPKAKTPEGSGTWKLRGDAFGTAPVHWVPVLDTSEFDPMVTSPSLG